MPKWISSTTVIVLTIFKISLFQSTRRHKESTRHKRVIYLSCFHRFFLAICRNDTFICQHKNLPLGNTLKCWMGRKFLSMAFFLILSPNYILMSNAMVLLNFDSWSFSLLFFSVNSLLNLHKVNLFRQSCWNARSMLTQSLL